MSRTLASKSWRAELDDILAVCTRRAGLSAALPHCAICARYSTDNLPFEALMSLLDAVPEGDRIGAVAIAEGRLAGVPPAMRQQHADAVTLPVLMDSPGWPLVRSLVIDMANQEVGRHLADPRLGGIEDVTLLGFAYGGCEVDPAFAEAFFNSPAFAAVRTLAFHSTEGDEALSRVFWASRLAARLERISGVPYFGDPVAGPLAVRSLAIANRYDFEDRTKAITFGRLLDPDVTPHLGDLSVGALAEGIPTLLAEIERVRGALERIASVTLRLSDYAGERTKLLSDVTLPSSVKRVVWHTDFKHTSILRPRRFEHVCLFDATSDAVDVRCGDAVTEYTNLVFDWRFRDHVSRRVEELSLLLPFDLDVADAIAFCDGLERLKRLTLHFPFAEADLETLAGSAVVRRLESLSLVLAISDGQWEVAETKKYMKANLKKYRSAVPADRLLAWALGDRLGAVPHLAVYCPSFDLARAPDRVAHFEVLAADAIAALAAQTPRLPIESLVFDLDVKVSAKRAAELAASGVLARVHRLSLRAKADDAAVKALAACPDLGGVRALAYYTNGATERGLRTLLHSPHLTGVWDLDLWANEAEEESPAGAATIADSPLLERVVALEVHGVGGDAELPSRGRLARLRRLGEGLSGNVLGDARIAAAWREFPLGPPLTARVRDFVDRTYRVEHRDEELPGLAGRLASIRGFDNEEEFGSVLRSYFAASFDGKPVAEGTPFANLSAKQQEAVRTLSRIDENWWTLGGLVRDATRSFGFEFWDQEAVVRYIDGVVDEVE